MLPKTVLHKKNGHAHPSGNALSAADMLRRVHSAHADADPVTADMLRFAHVVAKETPARLLTEAVRKVDALRLGLNTVLATTDEALVRGELADVRTLLDAFRAEADMITRTVTSLVGTAAARAAERHVIDVNEVIARVLGVLRYQLGTGVTVTQHADPALPAVAAQAIELERVVMALVSSAWPAASGAPCGSVTVETCRVPGPVHGEAIASVRIAVDGEALPAPSATVLALAADVAREHGGAFRATRCGDAGARFTLELPAV
jgi:signal transduction histidine kinase